MNREIKYRAWDEEAELWRYFTLEDAMIGRLVRPDGRMKFPLVKVCLLTGLKDKNGVDIYEGDIVQHGEGFGSRKRLIKYLEGHFFPVGTESGCGCCSERWPSDQVTVLGNVWEHPELLKPNP